MSSLCLSMIVKNEAHVLGRCLASVRPFLSHWVIADNGSTDETETVARRALEGVPGEFHHCAWKDFATNRNEALDLAKGKADYLLIMDADDVLRAPDDFKFPELNQDAYEFFVAYNGTSYWRLHLLRGDIPLRYEGALHEALVPTFESKIGRIDGVTYEVVGGGARSRDPTRYTKDAQLLKKELDKNPGHARTAFYYAQSLRDAGELASAIKAFTYRISLGGWEEELFQAHLEIAKLLERTRASDEQIIGAYLRAHQARPTRAEALYELSRYCRQTERMHLARVFAVAAAEIPKPVQDVLFVNVETYAWKALDEFAIACGQTGRHIEAVSANGELLAARILPPGERQRIKANMDFSLDALSKL